MLEGLRVADNKMSLIKEYTGKYKPELYRQPFWLEEKLPPFTLWSVTRMGYDPQVKLATRILLAPLMKAKFELTGDAEVVQFIAKTLKTVWRHSMHKILKGVKNTMAAGEVLYEYSERDKMFYYRGLIDYYPPDVRILTSKKTGRMTGIKVRMRKANKRGTVTLRRPKSFLYLHDREFNQWTGRSAYESAYRPWFDKAERDGALDIRRMWYYKCAFDGGDLYHPTGEYIDPDGNKIPYQDVARQMLEMEKTGGVSAYPNTYDENGNRDWERVRPSPNGSGADLINYTDQLDVEIARGIGITDDVMQQVGGTGSYAGRTVPLMAFFTSEGMTLTEVATAVIEQIVDPLVIANYGQDARYEVQSVEIDVDALMPETPSGENGQGGPQEEQQSAQQGAVQGESAQSAELSLVSKWEKSGASVEVFHVTSSGRYRIKTSSDCTGSPVEMAVRHAPKGGVSIEGRRYLGGQFIPEVGSRLSKQEAISVLSEMVSVSKRMNQDEFSRYLKHSLGMNARGDVRSMRSAAEEEILGRISEEDEQKPSSNWRDPDDDRKRASVDGVHFVEPEHGEGDVIVVKVGEIDKAWKRGPGHLYVAGGDSGKTKRFGDAVRKGAGSEKYPVQMPRVNFNDDGTVSFIDGRHRFAYMRESGLQAIPVVATGRVPGKKRPESTEMAVRHAPKGGITIKGTFYPGGRFIPDDVYAAMPPKERKRLKVKNEHTFKEGELIPADVYNKLSPEQKSEIRKQYSSRRLEQVKATQSRKSENLRKSETVPSGFKPDFSDIESHPPGSVVGILMGNVPDFSRTGKYDEENDQYKAKLQDIYRKLGEDTLSKIGYTDYKKASDQEVERLADALSHELQYALSQDNSGAGWYDREVSRTYEILNERHPEFLSDEAAVAENLPDSRTARGVFAAMLAITSNGSKVDMNLKRGEELYSDWKSTRKDADSPGVIDTNSEYGGPVKNQVNGQLKILNGMFEAYGVQDTIEILSSEMTPAEIDAFSRILTGKKKNPGELKGTKLKGSMIFGPKLGSFFNNLMGDYDTVTMDRWFMRTINRMTGDIFKPNEASIESNAKGLLEFHEKDWSRKSLGKFHDSLNKMLRESVEHEKTGGELPQDSLIRKWAEANVDRPDDDKERKMARSILGSNGDKRDSAIDEFYWRYKPRSRNELRQLRGGMDKKTFNAELRKLLKNGPDMTVEQGQYVNRLTRWISERESEYGQSKPWVDKAGRPRTYETGKKKGEIQEKSFVDKNEYNRTAHRLWDQYFKPTEAPFNGTHRAWMRKVYGRALEKLKNDTGIEITNADAQALHWYFEKELVGAMGGNTSRAVKESYGDAAEKLLEGKLDDLDYTDKKNYQDNNVEEEEKLGRDEF